MPSYWFTTREIEHHGFTQEQIEFDKRIVASHKPYFMTYVYPKLRSENNQYIKNSDNGVIRRFRKYGMMNIHDLEVCNEPTPEMLQYLEYYRTLSPVGNNSCLVNRIAWMFEKEFNGYLAKLVRLERDCEKKDFDYSILKSDTTYSQTTYHKVYQIYKDYAKLTQKYQQRKRIEKIDKFESWLQFQTYINWFRNECSKICPSEEELNNIVIDICYQADSSKQFTWDICGHVILHNLLNHHDGQINYPYCVDSDGDFKYFGKGFIMKKMNIKGGIE